MTDGSPAGDVQPVRCGVAVPAAGAGRRMGGARKAYLELRGDPILLWALRPFLQDDRVVAIRVALPAEDAEDPPSWLTQVDPRIAVVAGGAARADSVRHAIDALPEEVNVIAVHDAARPLISPEAISACIEVAAGGSGAVVGRPAVDTIKRVDADRVIEGTPDRRTLWHAETPQVFPADLLRRAYDQGGSLATDDAALVEGVGGRVVMVDGGHPNPKITRPEDLVVAEALLDGADR